MRLAVVVPCHEAMVQPEDLGAVERVVGRRRKGIDVIYRVRRVRTRRRKGIDVIYRVRRVRTSEGARRRVTANARYPVTAALRAPALAHHADCRVIPGWAPVVLPMDFLGGEQLLALGVMGGYLGRIHVESKDRPRFIVEQVLGGSAAASCWDRAPAAAVDVMRTS